MNMSKNERRATLAVSRRRYAEIKGRKRRGAFLDEFCAVTGLGRKHAIATFNGRNRRGTRRRGHPRKFSAEAARLLAKAWRLAGMPCGKLLRPVIATHVESGGTGRGGSSASRRSRRPRRNGYLTIPARLGGAR
ncbi:MAG: hypothetical protein FWF84_07200, partial [Kiritimatiellaeota bacterium]|nr:hypothetical protein [Kiritimatiellota bacterium]